MRTVWSALMSLSLALPLCAQAEVDGKSSQEWYDQLTEQLQYEKAIYSSSRERLMKSDAYREARKARDNARIRDLLNSVPRPDETGMAARAIELAARFEGDDKVRLLAWAGAYSRNKDIIEQILEEVRPAHLKSAEILPMVREVTQITRRLGPDVGHAFLDEVIAATPHDRVQAWAMYKLGVALREKRNGSVEDKRRGAELSAAARELAVGHPLGVRMAGPKFFADNLKVGQTVPELEGVDTEGQPLRLSDYRGKVVVLEFWGFWCKPCSLLMPYYKKLVAAHSADDFALIGVNSDASRRFYREQAKQNGVTWRSFYNGIEGANGWASSRWGIPSWPMTFVIDREGVIRHTRLRAEKLAEAVAELVNEKAGK